MAEHTAPTIDPVDPTVAEALARLRAVLPAADPLAKLPDVHPARLPRHIAVIMDGNGRWATARGLPRPMGHKEGAKSVRRLVSEAGRLGIEYVTLYSFSTENWKRPKDEIDDLMALCEYYCKAQLPELLEHGIRVRVIGSRKGLPESVLAALDHLVAETHKPGKPGPTLCLAINYGSREEITEAFRTLARRVKLGELDPEAIDQSHIAGSLSTAGMPDPDLLIRTAGELRVSNYLLWQISYAEIFVTQTLWPEFDEASLHEAVRAYARRDRRFGGLSRK